VEQVTKVEELDGAASGLSDVLGIRIKRELFKFSSQQDWVNNAQSRYANCSVPKGHYITVDSAGHILHMGKCFMEAEKNGLYPVTVYELQTNWDAMPNAALRPRAEGESSLEGTVIRGDLK